MAALAREIELAAIPDVDQRAEQTLAYILEQLDVKGRWSRAHAARELQRFARSRRDLVDRRVEDRVAGLLASRIPREQRRLLQTLQTWFTANPWRAPKIKPPVRDQTPVPRRRPAWQREFLELEGAARVRHVRQALGKDRDRTCERAWWYFDEGQEATRLVTVRHIGRTGDRTALSRLRRVYVKDSSDEVRMEVVAAIGRLGDEREVAWLGERLENVQARRSALLALARIRSAEALRLLRTIQERGAASEVPGERREARWVEFLLSPAFEASLGGS